MSVRLRLFAQAREAAGTDRDDFDAGSLDSILEAACIRYGEEFRAVLAGSRVWVDGEEPASGGATEVPVGAEVAVLPPVSGGCPDEVR